MVERITSEKDLQDYIGEREFVARLRNAVSYCKNALEITATVDYALRPEERLGLERCLTENYLVKRGYNYFGKRDLIYIDLFGSDDVRNMEASI